VNNALSQQATATRVALGNLARKTLGMLLNAVDFDAAERGVWAVALSGSQAAGYVLYRLPRNRVTLVHLCVRPEFQGRKDEDRPVDVSLVP
jgi:ribosomal protein S18 acetylase RimI-like enzyme